MNDSFNSEAITESDYFEAIEKLKPKIRWNTTLHFKGISGVAENSLITHI